MCIWNPTISKSMKLLNSPWGTSFNTKYGFGYDDSRDDYKALFIDHYHDFNNGEVYNVRIVVTIYSLRNDSWKTLHDQLKGIFLINHSGKFVNGMLYWIASTCIDDDDARNIISFDVANETWGSLEIPIRGEDHSNIKLGVVGSDLAVLYTCHICATTSDVWILKDYRGNMSWTKRFTIEYPKYVVLYMFSSPNFTFSIHLRQSNKEDIILSIRGLIILFDGSTKKLEHIAAVGGYNSAETYAESIVNPLTISGKNSA
ncbi:F-box/kelch-repeat protein At3g23880-like [Solanum tuberosum]|uniref:F-box/kelch-repeat protein At3g23880-like n=1 Tax=Solanum tuberosum TaxID=4113 RepID=UPI00073A2854|nr:PREDICTED: F-box/kelch-repeat protein At3g23880-like [Solanum tuberosum]